MSGSCRRRKLSLTTSLSPSPHGHGRCAGEEEGPRFSAVTARNRQDNTEAAFSQDAICGKPMVFIWRDLIRYNVMLCSDSLSL